MSQMNLMEQDAQPGAIPDASGYNAPTGQKQEGGQVDPEEQLDTLESDQTEGEGDGDTNGAMGGGDVSSALDAVDSVLSYGYKKMGLLQGSSGSSSQSSAGSSSGVAATAPAMAEGGAIEEPPTAPPSAQPAIPDNAPVAPAAGAPAAAPAPGGGNPQIMSLLQGSGAMPTPQAQALERQQGTGDPNMAKLKAVQMLAKTQGPDAAFSYMQSLRKQYDLQRTFAANKANNGDLNASTAAATQAMTNILDGTKTQFAPAGNGKVKVSISRVAPGQGAPKPQGYADGGAVTPDDGAIPDATAQQTTEPQAPAASDSGSGTIWSGIMSAASYVKDFLMGKSGQYDSLHSTGTPAAVQQVATNSDENRQQIMSLGQRASDASPVNQTLRSVSKAVHDFGNDGATPPAPANAAAQPPATPGSDAMASADEAPLPQGTSNTVNKGVQPGGPSQPRFEPKQDDGGLSGNGGDQQPSKQQRTIANMSVDEMQQIVNRNVPGTGPQSVRLRSEMMERMLSTQALVQGRSDVANTRGQYYFSTAQLRAATSTANGQAHVDAMLRAAAMRSGDARWAAFQRLVASKNSQGIPLTEQELSGVQTMLQSLDNQQQPQVPQNAQAQPQNDQSVPPGYIMVNGVKKQLPPGAVKIGGNQGGQ